MAEPVPNRASDPRRRALVHFYNGEMSPFAPMTNYSHSAEIRRTKRGDFHEGDTRRNMLGFSVPNGYSTEVNIPADKINYKKPKKGQK